MPVVTAVSWRRVLRPVEGWDSVADKPRTFKSRRAAELYVLAQKAADAKIAEAGKLRRVVYEIDGEEV